VISGLTPADGGQIRLGVDRLDGLSAHAIARRGVGRTFQIPRPLGRMTVLENVLVYAHDQPGEGLTRVFTTPKRVSAAEHRARERAYALLDTIASEFIYERGATTVQTTADEVLELRRGVCQDFAHVFLGACRASRIPCRYVSGYLYDVALEGGHAASHAWVDVWTDEQGWISLDPTHNRPQTEHYVRVAVGRDYADVPPTRGVYRGTATETLAVIASMTAV